MQNIEENQEEESEGEPVTYGAVGPQSSDSRTHHLSKGSVELPIVIEEPAQVENNKPVVPMI